MDRSLYITIVNLLDTKNHGVNSKIFSQIDSLKKYSKEVDYIYKTKNEIIMNDKIKREFKYSLFRFREMLEIIDKKYDIVYIRYCMFDFYLIKILKKLKKLNPNVKIVLEIPTYPITNMSSKKKYINKFFYFFAMKYIDRIITFQLEKEIWGKQTIQIFNGIDPQKYNISKKSICKNTIDFISVSGIFKMHGIDRIIRGISEYKENKNFQNNIKFHIIGEGPEKQKLEKLVKDLNLENDVKFYGFKKGKELDDLFDLADIGIGSLSLFRENLTYLSSLKTKEYSVRGLPFIVSYNELAYPQNVDYIYKVVDNSSPINIEELLLWYKNIKTSKNEIRNYAEENFTWDSQIKKILLDLKI